MCQERLVGLMLPFVEQDIAEKLSPPNILQQFEGSRNRRLDFGF